MSAWRFVEEPKAIRGTMRCGPNWLSRTLRGGQYSPDFFGNLGERKLFQVLGVAIKLPDALSQFLCRHRVFVVHPAECLLIQVEAFFLAAFRDCRIELTIQRSLGLLELVKEVWADGEQVASGQADNLVHIPEAGAHHLGLVAVFLVVVVDARDGRNAGILVCRNLRTALLFLIPVVDAADERRDQRNPSLGACDGLGEAEQKCEVAVNAFLLQYFGRPDALPRTGDLDQDPFTRYALFLVQRNEFAAFGDRGRRIETQAGGDLSRDPTGNHFEDLASKQDEKPIDELCRHFLVAVTTLQG